MELTNLAGDPAYHDELNKAISFFVKYQATAVEGLDQRYTQPDPASNPALRPDQTWGPFVNSSLCKY
jgi:hypothetical protein